MKLEEVLSNLEKWGRFGRQDRPNGNVVLGSPETGLGWGWAVGIAAPVDLTLPTTTGFEVPNFPEFRYYRETLKVLNTLRLFRDTIFLYGVHVETQREIPTVYDIYLANAEQREFTERYDAMLVGGSELEEQSISYFEKMDGSIVAIDIDTEEELAIFPSLEDCLVHQIAQIEAEAEPDGKISESFEFKF